MTLETIMLIYQLACPKTHNSTLKYYGQAIETQSYNHNIDPYTIVAIAKHESNCDNRAVSPDGEDYGLMQVRAKFSGISRGALFDGPTNIRAAVKVIEKSQQYCSSILDREPNTQEWMSCYQGSCGHKRTLCHATRLTNIVENYAFCLEDEVNQAISINCNEIYEDAYRHKSRINGHLLSR